MPKTPYANIAEVFDLNIFACLTNTLSIDSAFRITYLCILIERLLDATRATRVTAAAQETQQKAKN
jgi:hypothetical protein